MRPAPGLAFFGREGAVIAVAILALVSMGAVPVVGHFGLAPAVVRVSHFSPESRPSNGRTPSPVVHSNATRPIPGSSYARWTSRSLSPAPSGGISTWDTHDGYLLLFGGGSTYDQTWTYSNATWTELFPSTHPTGRIGSGVVYDANDGYVLLYGGYNASTYTWYGDTWEWSGGAWTQLSPSSSPGQDASFGMTYDSADNYVLLFGGTPNYGGNTWTYSGGAWTQVTTSGSPPGRGYNRLDYDPHLRDVVLYGGINNAGGMLYNDTWLYHAGTWSNVTGVNPPQARMNAQVKFDPGLDLTLMYGGELSWGASATNGTWTFDGTKWTQLLTGPDPGARVAPPFTWDPVQLAMIMIGGSLTGDTATWSLTSFSASAIAESQSSIDVGQVLHLSVTAGGGSGNYSYAWSGLPLGCTSTNLPAFSCLPNAPGNAFPTVVISDPARNQSATGYGAEIFIHPAPSVSLNVSVPISDVNKPITITSTAYSGSGGFAYIYHGLPPGCSTANSAVITCQPSQGGPYVLTVTAIDSDGGSTTSAGVRLIVNPAPTVTLSVKYNPVDVGVLESFNSTPLNGSPGYSYEYYNLPPGCVSQNLATILCVPGIAGPYAPRVHLIDSEGLTADGPLSLVVDPRLQGTASAESTNASVSQGVVLSVSATGGTPGYAYQWTVDGVVAHGATGSTFKFPQSGLPGDVVGSHSVAVIVTDLGGGNVTTNAVQVQVSAGATSSGATFAIPLIDFEVLIVAAAGVGVIVTVLLFRRGGGRAPRPPGPTR